MSSFDWEIDYHGPAFDEAAAPEEAVRESARVMRAHDDPGLAYVPEIRGQHGRGARHERRPGFYDCLLEHDGHKFMLMPIMNYADGDHEAIRTMFTYPRTISGLSDAGAHDEGTGGRPGRLLHGSAYAG